MRAPRHESSEIERDGGPHPFVAGMQGPPSNEGADRHGAAPERPCARRHRRVARAQPAARGGGERARAGTRRARSGADRRGDRGFPYPRRARLWNPGAPCGHRRRGAGCRGVGRRAGVPRDPGMNNGVDNRHQSWQVEPTAMELFADAVGADETLFSTNGSTENVHVAMMTAVRPGETLVMARNGHKSAFSGLVISGAMPVYVQPEYDERWQVAHGVDPQRLHAALDDHPEAAAAIVFTPTYYG